MNGILRKACRANLLKALERLKQQSDPSVVAQATMAEALFLDFESSEKPASEPGAPEDARGYNDTTGYEKYRLLHSFGLSPEQLLEVAKVDGLHELRVLRMLRIVFDLSLDEATRLLNAKTAG